jgi:UDP-2-acetamido-3-amino-2,3-dideoxy-glucuronate N-acetyltransferase
MNSIAKDFKFGANFKIGHFCVIEDDVIVGDNVDIGSHVIIKSGCRIGNDVTLKDTCGLGRGVTLKDRVFVSPRVTFIVVNHNKESVLGTVIGDDCFIGTGALIGLGVRIIGRTIIGAMSFVNNHILSQGTYVGVPVRKIR